MNELAPQTLHIMSALVVLAGAVCVMMAVGIVVWAMVDGTD